MKEKVKVEIVTVEEAKRRYRPAGKTIMEVIAPDGKVLLSFKSENMPDLYCDFCNKILTVMNDDNEEEKPLFVIEDSDLVCEECFNRWKGWMEKDNFEVEIIGGEE